MAKKPIVYQAVIGLEIHVQLLTDYKMFAPESMVYGRPPNTQTSAVSLAHPGAMPTINKQAICYAIRMGLACHSDITKYNWFDRKNYYYVDSPKGFQITQNKTPICRNGFIVIDTATGIQKEIGLEHIHLEEDTGKSIHATTDDISLINFDRAGMPLIEIVTKPNLSTAEEASLFLKEVRRLVRYLGISNGNMEEGSLRCDVNVSIMPKGSTVFGNKVELKNMNSMRHVRLAIEHEIRRQTKLKEKGEEIIPQTRSYNVQTEKSVFMRNKDTLTDYCFFTEPDISPFCVSEDWIHEERKSMPILPRTLAKKFTEVYQLTPKDVAVLVDEKEMSMFFEAVCQKTTHYKVAANWVIGPIKSYLNREKIPWQDFPISSKQMAALADIVKKGLVCFSIAVEKLFSRLIADPSLDPYSLIGKQVLQVSNTAELIGWIDTTLEKYPEKVIAYKKGQQGLIGLFMGEIMKLSKRKADPKKTIALLQQKLNSIQAR